MKKQSKMIIAGAAVAALIIVAIVAAVFAARGGTNEYDAHLNMAQQYLDELNYEQAVAELRMAIEIEPDNSAAYLALAEVYVAMGDYESALAVLEEGYAATGDTELSAERERIAREYAELQKQQAEQERKEREQQAEQEQREQEQRVKEFYEKYAELMAFAWEKVFANGRGRDVFARYLTYGECEQVYGGLVEQFEQCLAELDEIKGVSEEDAYFYKVHIYEYLADIYLRMGKSEECLRVRTEWATFCDKPDLVQDGNRGYYKEFIEGNIVIYDRYGRVTSSTPGDQRITIVYGEAHDGAIHYTAITPEYTSEDDGTYDSEGRISHIHRVKIYENGEVHVYDDDYSYTGNNSYVQTRTYFTPVSDYMQLGEYFYDEYGWRINP